MRNQTTPSIPVTRLFGNFDENGTYLDAVQADLLQLEEEYTQYLEQESVKSDVQCLRSWVEACLSGDAEATEYLQEHGVQLLDNVKMKLQAAAREMQRVDEESPTNGSNFSGGKADRLTKAAQTALDAEGKLCLALDREMNCGESPIVAK